MGKDFSIWEKVSKFQLKWQTLKYYFYAGVINFSRSAFTQNKTWKATSPAAGWAANSGHSTLHHRLPLSYSLQRPRSLTRLRGNCLSAAQSLLSAQGYFITVSDTWKKNHKKQHNTGCLKIQTGKIHFKLNMIYMRYWTNKKFSVFRHSGLCLYYLHVKNWKYSFVAREPSPGKMFQG